MHAEKQFIPTMWFLCGYIHEQNSFFAFFSLPMCVWSGHCTCMQWVRCRVCFWILGDKLLVLSHSVSLSLTCLSMRMLLFSSIQNGSSIQPSRQMLQNIFLTSKVVTDAGCHKSNTHVLHTR